jgi:hypothetical protein
MADVQQLLHFRGQALTQFVLVATIFGAFAMSGVIALIATHEKARIRSFLFVVLAIASLAFIIATLVSVIIIPFMSSGWNVPDKAALALMRLYAVVVVAIIAGTVLLAVGLASVGFMISRFVGRIVLGSTIVASLIFLACALYLRGTLR